MADANPNPAARRIHEELADRYTQQAEAIEREAAADQGETIDGGLRRSVASASA